MTERHTGLDILKAICAFLVVCIHIPFPGAFGEYFTALCRVAVPIFFMITGFFYKKDKAKKSIIKSARLFIIASILYFVFGLLVNGIEHNIGAYLSKITSFEMVIKFVFLNVSPFSGHLWYLSAVLYVQIIVYLLGDKHKKILYRLTPVLLICDLVFGKYSLLLFERQVPYILLRNFIFVGIPYFCIGEFIAEHKKMFIDKRVLGVLSCLFIVTSLLERYLLVMNGTNAARDHYISTTFLSVCLFELALKYKGKNAIGKHLSIIGKEYSGVIYVIHPMLISIFNMIAIKELDFLAPFIIYIGTLLLVSGAKKIFYYVKKRRE